MRASALAAFLSLAMGCGGEGDIEHDAASPPRDAAGVDAPFVPRDSGPPIDGCSAVPSGRWEEITPPDLHRDGWCTPDFDPSGCGNPGDMHGGHTATYGAHGFALAPSAPGTIYLGTSSLGFWRSTDCGAHWMLADGGGSEVDAGRNWTIAVDPNDAMTLYTTAGYGAGGVWKSTDGGASWTSTLSPAIAAVASFVEKITMDPTDASHLVVSFHDACLVAPVTPDLFAAGTALSDGLPVGAVRSNASGGSPGWGCLAETRDAGAHWTLVANALAWEGLDGPGQAMVDGSTWFYATNAPSGIWLTTTGGVSPDGTSAGWRRVVDGSAAGSVYVAHDHSFYSGANGSVIRSTNGVDWTPVGMNIGLGSVNGSTPIVQGGTHVYVSSFSFTGPARYYVADAASPSFTELTVDASAIPTGASQLDFDERYGVLYSSNMVGGLWRLRP